MGFHDHRDEDDEIESGDNKKPESQQRKYRDSSGRELASQKERQSDIHIEDDNDEPVEQPRQRRRQSTNQTRNNNYQEQGTHMSKDPLNFVQRFTSPISSLAGSYLERFSQPIKDFMENYKEQMKVNYGLDIEIFPIPTEISRIKVEAVVIAATRGIVGEEDTLAYTLLLPAATSLGTQYTEGERGRNGMAYSAVASDALDTNFYANVSAYISDKGRGAKGHITHMGALTVPANYDLNDKEKVSNLIANAVTTIHYANISETSEINDMALVELLPQTEDERRNGRGSDYALTSNVTIKPEETVDYLGMPHSSDLSVEISLGRNQRNRGRNEDRARNALSLETNFTLGRLNASVDLMYIGEEESDGRRGRGNNKFRRSRRSEDDVVPVYGMALNVTDILTDNRDVMTLQLVTLANLPLLIKSDILESALLPTADETRLRDPRALLLEQPGDVDDIDVSEYPDEKEWANLMEALVHEDSTVILMHIPRTGIHNQLMTAIQKALHPENDSIVQDEGYAEINEVLNSMTDGKWFELGGDKLDIGEYENRQSLNGYWTGPNGDRLSLNAIGRFNLMTRYGKDHPEYLENYDFATDGQDSVDVSNAALEELINAYTSKSAVINDRNDVYRLNPEWLSTIAEATRRSGVTIDAEGISTESGRRRHINDRFTTGSMRSDLYRTRGGRGRRGNNW